MMYNGRMFMGLGLLFVFGLVVLCSLLGQGLNRLVRGKGAVEPAELRDQPQLDAEKSSPWNWFCAVFMILSCFGMGSPKFRKLATQDIYGTYRIDRSFYPGSNANWQYEHYQFEIKGNTLTLTEIDDKGAPMRYEGALTWSDQNTRRALWSAKMPEKHHLHFEAPQLFRSYWSFYYVVRSDKFGTMFFRKEGDFFRREYLLGLVLIPLVLWWKPRHYRPNKVSPKPATGP